jgi:hypothetical protein
VKIWKVPRPDEVTQYGDTDYIFNCNVGVFQKPNEVIWDLKHHPRAKLLVSLCADANIYLWETANADDYIQSITGKNLNINKNIIHLFILILNFVLKFFSKIFQLQILN